MKMSACSLAFLLLVSATVVPVSGKAPIPISTVATIEELVAEVEASLKVIEEGVSDFDENEDAMRQAAGMLSVFGQAIAEHDDNKKTKIHGPALRDAAKVCIDASDSDDIKTSLVAIKAAIAGKVTGEEPKTEYDWYDLIEMYDMMEIIDQRNDKLRRVAKRPKGTMEERLLAIGPAVLTVAMHAQSDYAEDEDVPNWNKLCVEYQESMTKFARAVEKKDRKTTSKMYFVGNKACTDCHREIRDK